MEAPPSCHWASYPNDHKRGASFNSAYYPLYSKKQDIYFVMAATNSGSLGFTFDG